nr:MAG TPA: hypothetical protein [Caudoviricetes sp.]
MNIVYIKVIEDPVVMIRVIKEPVCFVRGDVK